MGIFVDDLGGIDGQYGGCGGIRRDTGQGEGRTVQDFVHGLKLGNTQ